MRRVLSVLLGGLMALSLCACTPPELDGSQPDTGSRPSGQTGGSATDGEGSYTEVDESVPDTFSHKATNDMFEYNVYGRHVEITRYLGNQTDVKIPKGIEDRKVTVIGEGSFADRATLNSVYIPSTVTDIADRAFQRCYYLKEVTGCEGVRRIGERAFAYAEDLTVFPWEDSLETVGTMAFNWCSSLESIHIKSACDVIGDYAFRNCVSAKTVEFDDSLVSIGKEAFMRCDSITEIVYPYASEGVGEGVFKHCNALAKVTFQNQVTVIANRAFQNSRGIEEITVPAHILAVEDYAFGSCHAMKTATFEGSVVDLGNYLFLQVQGLTIKAPAGSTAEFYATTHDTAFEPLEAVG